MDISRQREVVLEIEHRRVVRKRTKTSLRVCPGCNITTDFVELTIAAGLFGIANLDLFDFIRSNRCHYVVKRDGDIYLCLADLLSAMKRKMNKSTVKLIGSITK